METVLRILKDIRGDIDFSSEERLIDDGILDSFDIISIVGELNDTFDVEIDMETLTPENFNSAHNIYLLIQKLQSEM